MEVDPDKEVRDLLLCAEDTQLDASMFPLIEKWKDPPGSVEILEVLDNCIHYSLASGFVIVVLEGLLNKALKREGKKLEDILPFATWRLGH